MNKRQQLECEVAAETLRQSGRLRFRASGTSMLPVIWPGDVLEVVRVAMEDVQRGEVVLFLRGGRMFAHRVLRNGGDRLVTQGDANLQCDAPVTVEEFLGRVVTIERRGRIGGTSLGFRGRMWSAMLRREGVLGRMGRHLHAAVRRAR